MVEPTPALIRAQIIARWRRWSLRSNFFPVFTSNFWTILTLRNKVRELRRLTSGMVKLFNPTVKPRNKATNSWPDNWNRGRKRPTSFERYFYYPISFLGHLGFRDEVITRISPDYYYLKLSRFLPPSVAQLMTSLIGTHNSRRESRDECT